MAAMRDRVFQFRISENELWLIQQAAEIAGVRPSDWARQWVLQAAVSLASNKDATEINLSMRSTGQVKTMSST